MKEVINNMIKHPFRTTMIISGLASAIVGIVHAVKDTKTKSE
jgi:hypothetical protein